MIIGKFKKLFEEIDDSNNEIPTGDGIEDMDNDMIDDGEENENEFEDEEQDLFDKMANFITTLDQEAIPEEMQDAYNDIVTLLSQEDEEGEEGEEEEEDSYDSDEVEDEDPIEAEESAITPYTGPCPKCGDDSIRNKVCLACGTKITEACKKVKKK